MNRYYAVVLVLLLQAVFWLGQGLFINYGALHVASLALLAVVATLLLKAFTVERTADGAEASGVVTVAAPHAVQRLLWAFQRERQAEPLSLFQLVLGGLCLLQIVQVASWVVNDPIDLQVASWGVVGLAVAAGAGVVWSWFSPRGWWLQLASFLGMALVAIHGAQGVGTDVLMFQKEASAALLRGINPYSITFANPYPPDLQVYAANAVANGRLQFGYVYFPLPLLMVVPAYLLGDVRFAHMLCVALAALLFTGRRPTRLVALAGSLLLWTPLVLYVVVLSWTESLSVLWLGLVVYCARRQMRWLFVATGLLLASKQYFVLLLPLLWLLKPTIEQDAVQRGGEEARRQAFGRFLAKTLLVGTAVTLPMALWNWHDFMKSVVLLQFQQPFRKEALSFPALLVNLGMAEAPWWLPFALLVPATWLALKCAPRSAMGYCLSMGWVFLVFVSFNKQAFANYYYFVLVALAAAAVCAAREVDRGQLSEK